MSNRDFAELSKALWHPMIDPKITQATPPFMLERGEGAYVWDIDGNKLLDGVAGMWCVNVGHRRQEIIDAVTQQLNKIAYFGLFGNQANIPSIELAARVIEMMTTEDMAQVMFSSGGSDANETALKFVRQYWQLKNEPLRNKIISLRGGYHGVHFGTLSISGFHAWRDAYEPLIPGCIQIEAPDLYRGEKAEDPEAHGRLMVDLLEREILYHGKKNVAAFWMEPVLGAGAGVIVPPANYMPLVREICDRYDILLVADEVITGFGRTGSLFGSRHWGVKPDIMNMAKGINSGYIPLGATAVNHKVAAAWSIDSPLATIAHGYTHSGHAVACASALANLDIVEKEDLPGNAKKIGGYLLKRLQEEFYDYPIVGDVRGLGLMICVDLVSDRANKTPFPNTQTAQAIYQATRRHGAIIRPNASRMLLAPPLILTKEQADELITAMHAGFKEFLSQK